MADERDTKEQKVEFVPTVKPSLDRPLSVPEDRSLKGDKKPIFNRSTSVQKGDIKFYKQSSCLLIALDAFLIVLIIVTGYYLSKEEHPNIYERDAKFCIPCDDVRLHPDDEFHFKELPSDNSTCCVNDNRDLDMLVEHFADKYARKTQAAEKRKFVSCTDENSGRSYASIKVVGTTNTQIGDSRTKVKWHTSNESDLAYTRDIKYEEGDITILEAGLHFVYSQMIFQHNMSVVDNGRPNLFSHTVFLKPFGSTTTEKVILSSSNSKCQFQQERHNSTSYLGTSYQFRKGDKIYVKVHNRAEIYPSEHMNFFGIHRI